MDGSLESRDANRSRPTRKARIQTAGEPAAKSRGVVVVQKLRWALKALPVVLFALCSATWAEPAKPDSAEAAAAMERAQRIASNPMRVILQASKFRRKAAEVPEPVDDSSRAARRLAWSARPRRRRKQHRRQPNLRRPQRQPCQPQRRRLRVHCQRRHR